MLPLKIFTFSPFQENMYILSTANKECIVFDPGCFYPQERDTLIAYFDEKKITPKRLINTHAHIDHIFGNALIYRTYNILPEIHKEELHMLTMAPSICEAYGFEMPEPSPIPEHFIEEGDTIELGEFSLLALLTPGHSVASLSFYCESHGFLIAGDVLFKESIGRTDLPGGDYDTLINVVKEKLFTLPDDTVVYPGHGPHTTIGYEKRNNPFFQ
jgi:glyoxylase-like metal-dependent hydrolase (beta-lactamase superfamily II)